MSAHAQIGVFLCQCGNNIEPAVDLPALARRIGAEDNVGHCQILPYACLKPGMAQISQAVIDGRLNRVVIGGCEGRIMLKKFETELAPLELLKGQIDMVNLRGHVAAVSDLDPAAKAVKGAKLLGAAVAEMATLRPSVLTRARIAGPVMIVGGGVASYAAAQELDRQGVDYCLSVEHTDPEAVIAALAQTYPGAYDCHERLKKTVAAAVASPHATVLPPGRLTALSGVTGDYTLTFSAAQDPAPRSYKSGAIISCLDAQLSPPGPEFGHDGRTALMPSEMAVHIQRHGAPSGRIVFWISDYESGQPEFARLSARTAWAMAMHMLSFLRTTRVVVLYNSRMEIPLSAAERAVNRKKGILWIPYDANVRPSVQDGVISFCNLSDHVEHEIDWDYLVLSPERVVAGGTLQCAEVLGLVHKKGRFLTGHHARVRPEMVGREESYLAGSARLPCDLPEALAQGRKAAGKTADMLRQSAAGALFIPRVVCVVDPKKCIGCGQCQELCDCGGIGVESGPGGGLPRVVDPMVCTGGGTCAAACPYHALVLQNNSNDQREARVAALARQLAPDESMAIACGWGGLPAADIAGKSGLRYDPRIHILGVPCVGQIDPCIMACALKDGAPGLILIGCMPEACHHSYGVDHTWSRVSVIKKLLSLCGFDRRRIALAHADLNRPEAFIQTVDSFTRTIAAIGPIEKTRENQRKLDAIYALVRDNTRVRHLLSAGLRRPWEEVYRGDQRHALDYDRDFSAALREEFLQQRLLMLIQEARKPIKLRELTGSLHEAESQVMACLSELVFTGVIDCRHENREALYAINA